MIGQSKPSGEDCFAKVMRSRAHAVVRVCSRTMVAVFLAAHAVVALRVYASGALFSTVGVYDEPTQTNSVDFIAEGSTLALSQFKSDIETAFNNDFGGVNQCYAI